MYRNAVAAVSVQVLADEMLELLHSLVVGEQAVPLVYLNRWRHILKQADFLDYFYVCTLFKRHCFICRPSHSTVSEDAGIESRTAATSALAVRRSSHSATSYPTFGYISSTNSATSYPHTQLHLIHNSATSHPQTRLHLIHNSATSHPLSATLSKNFRD